MIDLNQLNPQQRAAVEQTEGPLLVLAGAGSGKTRVLTYRVAWLMEKGVAPWHILAITFTNKAAREMAERVHALAGEASEDAWISTFHSCCARILRRDIEKLGYKRQFTIYDETDRTNVIKLVAKALGLSEREYPPKQIRTVISDAKNRLLTPREWLKESGGDFRSQKLFEAYREYEKALRENNALDFDDLLLKTLELLVEQPPVLEYYREKFRYILVDEYQDTNAAQYMLVRLLAGERHTLCVVGADDQSISGWRGANPRNILDFEKDFPECVTIKLEQNYRSTGNILDAANQVIAHNRGRKEKALWTESGQGERIALYHAMDEREEASFISAMTRKLIRAGAVPGSIAVLYRTNAQSRVLEEAFVHSGIQYRVYGAQRFYERKEVKDLVAYMRALVNPDDDVSTRRIINVPKRGIGEGTVDKLEAYARENGLPLLSAALDVDNTDLPARAKKQIGEFAALIVDLTEQMYEKKPSGFLEELIERTEYVKALEEDKNEENQSRIENIRELQGAVSEFERLNPEGELSDFLENVALVSDLDAMNEAGGAVTLMTLHSAKGLEFDHVFMTGMEEGVFPLSRAVFDDDLMEEERRLAYVGITRAKKRLFMTHARTRALYNTRNNNELSRFVSEIPQRLIAEGLGDMGTRRVPPPSHSAQRWDQTARSPYSPRWQAPEGGGPEGPGGVPGVKKGGFNWNNGVSSAGAGKPATVFHVGDAVYHRIFGKGQIVDLTGEGAKQRVKIRFVNGSERTFSAAAAPIVKTEP
ncbi:MAG: UvrD-helicase domain-containing protein [Clostridia bacterium]|nr:UvrD-helicase domain-containing protein [Clostridia bacterium]